MTHTLHVSLLALVAALLAWGTAWSSGEQPETRPKVKVVPLEPGGQEYFVLLAGPPETASMRSGLVTLAPGASVGKHSTGSNEEMLVPLSGEGELRISGFPPIQLRPGLITYAPTHTEHDVVNTGSTPLRYIFIVTKAE